MFPMNPRCPSTPQSLTPKMMQLRFGANSPRPSPFYSPTSNSVQHLRCVCEHGGQYSGGRPIRHDRARPRSPPFDGSSPRRLTAGQRDGEGSLHALTGHV